MELEITKCKIHFQLSEALRGLIGNHELCIHTQTCDGEIRGITIVAEDNDSKEYKVVTIGFKKNRKGCMSYPYEKNVREHADRCNIILCSENNRTNVFSKAGFGIGFFELIDGVYKATKNYGSDNPDIKIFDYAPDAIDWITV